MARIGEMRQRITLQNKGTPTRNDYGEEVITWANVATVWAKEVPFRGREIIANAQESGERLTRFSIRYRPGVVSSMRILKDSGARIFEIIGPPENVGQRNRELLITAREILNE